jgi:hypothetical protein
VPKWLVATSVVVVLLQLASGSWRSHASLVPWSLLVAGQAVTRAWVEPLGLLGERYGVDLCLAALLAAWLPAAWRWLRAGRSFRAVASLLVPLALATPLLTPPLYGDEPFHLTVMESLASDRDLDLSNNLHLDQQPQNATYTLGSPLAHSPALGVLLLPGYLLAGRAGALALLAICGGVLVVLIRSRASHLGVPGTRAMLVCLGLALTYPVATYATQIWPELAGALAVVAVLVLAEGHSVGSLRAALIALLATVIKTRLALVTFPVAVAAWLREHRRHGVLGLLVLAVAAALGLGFGWLAMGHPFGHYRRLAHLVPDDPIMPLRVIGGLLFDHAGGVAFAAPLILVAIASVGVLWRRGSAGERGLVIGGLLTLLSLLHSYEWYGGGSPPARYLVPLLPAFALTWGLILTEPVRWRRLGEVLLAPSVVVWWVLVTRPHLSVNPGDGGWWLADVLARRFNADTQQFFPSFLVPTTATVWFPPVAITLFLAVRWIASRNRRATQMLVRTGLALWLLAGAVLAIAVTTRYDRVVELEAPQVRRRGGRPLPPPGTFSSFKYRMGRQLRDGDSAIVPLHLPAGATVWLEGWLQGTAQQGAEVVTSWKGGREFTYRVGRVDDGRVRVPDTPGPGRHMLRISVRAPSGGAVALDRVIVERRQ